MKKEYDFRKAQRGRFTIPKGTKVRRPTPRVVNINFDVTQEVAAALRTLRGTGLFGNGCDCASVAEELLRRALLAPSIAPFWQCRKGKKA